MIKNRISGLNNQQLWGVGIALLFVAILAVGLAWISLEYVSFQGWGIFVLLLLLSAGLLYGIWRILKLEDLSLPGWIAWLLLGAALLRLAVGVFWYVALPGWGYGTESELAGYVMSDAYSRDTAAWELAQSNDPLWTAFQSYRTVDQYGGLLFFSALIYRYLGGEVHMPLTLVVVTAAFSALAVIFTWAFTRQVWDAEVACWSAWIVTLYPEALLLGSSQMREAFTMTLAAAGFYGLVRFWKKRTRLDLVWVLGALTLSLSLSPLFMVWLLGALVLAVLALDQGKLVRDRRLWIMLAGLLIVALAVVWLFGDRIFPGSEGNPLTLIREWLIQAARWQARISQNASGWVDKILRNTPEWMRVYLLLAYGVARPFLPAAILATGAPLWRGIAIWRSLGWALMLSLLIYAPLRAIRKIKWWTLTNAVIWIVWLSVFSASYRGGGDQHDNPRYRIAFVGLQAALAAWVWVEQRRDPDPWLRRVLVGMGCILVWFVPWYLRRYSPLTWPVQDVFKTFGLGLITAILYMLWDWARTGGTQAEA
jgi:hypothetical protein